MNILMIVHVRTSSAVDFFKHQLIFHNGFKPVVSLADLSLPPFPAKTPYAVTHIKTQGL